MAVLANNIEIIVVLSYSNQSHKLRMMTNFDWSHDLSFKLFFSIWWTNIILNFFNRNLSASPFPLKNFRRMPKSNFLLKPQRTIINNILFCTFLNFLNNEPFKINKAAITTKILLRYINLFYFRYHLFFLLL